ncbi:uncharacterized protein LOC132731386 [Ruditapes philippinarum]|uniref:uncharacterized protein LOC132731386 n=1 Tax=Ruditapes philippinarum TaxID=129788 RepID=UPI00295B9863|nr:uncharacterized protein LOC132731386 [Ruditapes philippinarum]
MAAPFEFEKIGQNSNIIDELESSFLNCLSLLTTQEQINVQDSEETKTSIENAMQKFLELSRQTEALFLRKRMLVSYQKPEQQLVDDIENLKGELARKEALLEKHTERLKRCQIILQQQGVTPAGQPVQQSHPVSTQPNLQLPQSHTVPQQQPHMAQSGSLPHYSSHHIQQIPSQAPALAQYQGYSGSIHSQSLPGPPPPMQSHPVVSIGPRPQAPPSYPQGPLAYLEQTTSNIGLPDRR